MAQITHGLRGILSHPRVYSAVQNLLGAESVRKEFVEDQVRPAPGMRVLDIGCGPGDVLTYMQSVDYWGFDTSPEYIAHAQSVYGGRAKFFCKELHAADLRDLPPFDVVLAMGLLHHLDDDIAKNLVNMAAQALRPGGRLLTF